MLDHKKKILALCLNAMFMQSVYAVQNKPLKHEFNLSNHSQTVVTRDAILRQIKLGKNLNEALSYEVPGLDVGSGTRTETGQTMRGRAAVIMIDGIMLNHKTKTLSRSLDSIDPFNIERVEVLSGATAVYGGGGTSGLINIITKKGSDRDRQIHGEFYSQTSSGIKGHHDLVTRVGQSLSYGDKTSLTRLSALYAHFGSYYDGNGHKIPPRIQGDQQESRELDALLTSELKLDKKQSFDIMAHYYDVKDDGLDYGETLDISANGQRAPSGYASGFSIEKPQEARHIHAQGSYLHKSILGHKLLAKVNYSEEKHISQPYHGTSSYFDYSRTGANLNLTTQYKSLEASYGVELNHEAFKGHAYRYDQDILKASRYLEHRNLTDVQKYPDITAQTLAGYTQINYILMPQWSVSGGYRFEHITHEIDKFATDDAYDVKNHAHLFNLGLRFKPHTKHQSWLNFSQNMQLPDAAKQVRTQLGQAQKAALQPIKTHAFELGYAYNGKNLQIKTTAYYSQQDKEAVFSTKAGRKPLEIFNHKQKVYGIEAMVRYQLNHAWSTGLSGNYLRTRVDRGEYDNTLPNIGYAGAPSVQAWVDWSHATYQWRLQSQTVQSIKGVDDEGKSHTLNSYTTLDSSLRIEMDYGNLNLGIQNLLDRDYATIWGQRAEMWYGRQPYHGTGRTYTLTYQYHF
tara:strand:+ start:1202 stop:3250 length:2049 start_codon:yes stop_codon:yes gene_type:complete